MTADEAAAQAAELNENDSNVAAIEITVTGCTAPPPAPSSARVTPPPAPSSARVTMRVAAHVMLLAFAAVATLH
eukprot:COSAG02_NODE_1993_length_10163_cov_11.874006_3_plen_74_part_00